LHPYVVEQSRLKCRPHICIRVRALRSSGEVDLLAILCEVSCEVTIVIGAAAFYVEVDAVENSTAEGTGRGAATEVVVPEVIGNILCVCGGDELVVPYCPSKGEKNLCLIIIHKSN
jgi:hypothetical protein